MERLSIDISGDQKSQIKALAALRGQSIKDYVLNRVLPESGAELEKLEFLRAQIDRGDADIAAGRVTEYDSAESLYNDIMQD